MQPLLATESGLSSDGTHASGIDNEDNKERTRRSGREQQALWRSRGDKVGGGMIVKSLDSRETAVSQAYIAPLRFPKCPMRRVCWMSDGQVKLTLAGIRRGRSGM